MKGEVVVDFDFDSRVQPTWHELERIDSAEIKKRFPWAIPWAYNLEFLRGNNPNDQLTAPKYGPLFLLDSSDLDRKYQQNAFKVITWDPDSITQGIVLSDLDMNKLRKSKNGNPKITRFDPERRTKLLAERAWYLGLWNSYERGKYLYELQTALENKRSGLAKETSQDVDTPYPVRTHDVYNQFKYSRGSGITIEKIKALPRLIFNRLTHKQTDDVVWRKNPAIVDLTYLKKFDENDNRRNAIMDKGIFTRLGKYMRSPLALGPMYDASGSVDAIVTAAMSGMLATLPRNGVYADPERQYKLAREVMKKIESTQAPDHAYGEFLKSTWKRNVSVALGIDDPQSAVERAQKYVDLGITHFKVFTISSNTKIVETCRLLRNRFGDKIEIFAGQVADKTEALQLIAGDVRVDGLNLGHGGGRQCTSAAGGMAITTVQLLDNLRSDRRFQNTTIMVEGGVSDNPGVALLMGADGVYYFQRVEGAVGEGPMGDCMLEEEETGDLGDLYRGEASVATAVIEAALSRVLKRKHFNPAGNTTQTEGKWGMTEFHRKASSATHNTMIHLRYIAKMLADIGVSNLEQMRRMLSQPGLQILTTPTPNTEAVAIAYGSR